MSQLRRLFEEENKPGVISNILSGAKERFKEFGAAGKSSKSYGRGIANATAIAAALAAGYGGKKLYDYLKKRREEARR